MSMLCFILPRFPRIAPQSDGRNGALAALLVLFLDLLWRVTLAPTGVPVDSRRRW